MASALRPLGFGEILDGAFTLYRRHFGTMFLTALLPQLPVILIWLAVGAAAASGTLTDIGAVVAMVSMLIVLPYSLFATFLIWGALTRQVSEAYTGGAVSLGDGFGVGLRRVLPLIVAGLVWGIAMGFGFLLLIVPGILVAIMAFAITPAVVVEGTGPIEAFGRSRMLASGAWGRIFGIYVVAWIIITLPNFALAMFGIGAAILATPDIAALAEGGSALELAFQATGPLVTALTTPFLVGALVLLYYDRRVRAEGLDLELATAEVARG